MSQKPPHKLLGPLCMGMGAFVVLLAVGIIPSDGDAGAPAWVGAVAGAGFLFAGMSLTLMGYGVPRHHPAYRLLGCLVITTLAVPANWIAFGPGERQFSGGLFAAGLSLFSDDANQLSGRIAFGIAAVVMDVIFVIAWAGLVRKLIAANR